MRKGSHFLTVHARYNVKKKTIIHGRETILTIEIV